MARDPELTRAWSRFVAARDAPTKLSLEADGAARERIAVQLRVVAVTSLTAKVGVAPWMDGVEARGDWRGTVTQTCSVTAEPFDTDFSGTFSVRAVPPGSDNAAFEEPEGEIDLSTPDPPDLLVDDAVDVAALVVEHLGLELPFAPRAPGVEYMPPEADEMASPFAVLAAIKPSGAA